MIRRGPASGLAPPGARAVLARLFDIVKKALRGVSVADRRVRIKHVRSVRSSQNDHVSTLFEPIHFYKYLVQGLFTFVMSATHATATTASNSINRSTNRPSDAGFR